MSMDTTDKSLLLAWRQHRDADAFRTLAQRYARVVYGAALRILGNPADAEDVAQECLEKLATARHAPADYLGAWLHRMATNRALDQVKSSSRRVLREKRYVVDSPDDTEVDWEDIYPLVDTAVNTLPEPLRQVVVGYYLEGATQEVIAERHGVARTTITYRLKQGIEQVRQNLQKQGVGLSIAGAGAMLDQARAAATMLPPTLTARLGRLALSGGVLTVAGTSMGWLALSVSVAIVVAAAGAIFVTIGGGLPPAQQAQSVGAVARIAQNTVAITPAPAAAQPPQATVVAVAAAADQADTPRPPVSGRIVDAVTGLGIVGAKLSIFLEAERRNLSTESNEEGIFSFEEVPLGKFSVVCRKANGYFLGRNEPDGAMPNVQRVELTAEQPAAEVTFSLGRGEGFRGTVVDERGKTVAGATVTGNTSIDAYLTRNTAVSGSDGSFEVTGFPKTVNLFVWAEAGNQVSKTYGPFFLPAPKEAEVLALYPEAVVHGRAVDTHGKPLPGLKVYTLAPLHADSREVTATTDHLGRFQLKGLFPGAASLYVADDVTNVSVRSTSLQLEAGEVVKDLDIVCSVGALTISGRVVDSHGRAIPEAHLEIQSASYHSARTNRAGQFSANGLAPGSYTIQAQDLMHRPATVSGVAAGSSNVVVVMEDGYVVRGRVVDSATQLPVPSFSIQWSDSPRYIFYDHFYTAVQEEEGKFEVGARQAGKAEIVVRVPGYLISRTPIEIGEDTTASESLLVELTPHPSVTGVVRTVEGTPVEGALLFSGPYESNDPDTNAAARTAADGTFSIAPEKLGYDHLTVFHRDYPTEQVPLGPAQAQGKPLEIVLEGGTELVVRVLHGGAPVRDAWIGFLELTLSPMPYTNDQGEHVFRTIGPGAWRVSPAFTIKSQPAGRCGMTQQVELGAGEREELEFNFERGTGSLIGTVLGDGELIQMRIRTEDGADRWLDFDRPGQDATGSYRLDELPAGPTTVEATLLYEEKNIRMQYRFNLQEGEAKVQDFDPSGGATVRGVVEGLQAGEAASVEIYWGDNPEAVMLDLGGHSAEFFGMAQVGENGSFTASGLQPGTYTFRVSRYRMVNESQAETTGAGSLVVEVAGETEVVIPTQ